MRISILLIISFLAITLLSYATVPIVFNYDSAWKEIDKLQQKGLPQSMQDKVDEIYNAAIKDHNTNEQIKALIYQLKYLQNVEENSNQKAIDRVEAELKKSSFPATALLHSMLAQMYWSYYESNRWQFQGRTETINFLEDDISTWDLKTITKRAILEYQKSLEQPGSLQLLSLEEYNLLIQPGDKDSEIQRPTLYDFLAHRALDFYINDESGLTKPSDEFRMNGNLYFQPANMFVKMNIVSPDSLSLHFLSIQILQDLIKFHLTDKTPDALVAVDIDRLHFVYDNSNITDKETQYQSALTNLQIQYKDSTISSLTAYTLASFMYDLANQYQQAASEKYKWNYQDALDLCNSTLSTYASYPGFENSYAQKSLNTLKAMILNISTDVQVENVVPGNMPIKVLLKTKNLTQMQIRIYRLNFTNKLDLNTYMSSEERTRYFVKLLSQKPVMEKTFILKDEGDYRIHSTEVAIPGLLYGRYLIFASDDFTKKFEVQNISYNEFTCSDLSCITQNIDNSTMMILSRKLGNPLSNVKVKRFVQQWDSKTGKAYYKSDWEGKSNKEGKLIVPDNQQGYWNNQYMLSLDKDSLLTGNLYFYRNNGINQQKKCILFTDRGIYRPGQVIYFKGLLFQTDGAKQNSIYQISLLKLLFMM